MDFLDRAVPKLKFKPAPEALTAAALLVVGSFLVFAIPFGAGWDEETHLIRAWEIASLEFIPNEVPRNELPYPAIYWRLSYRRAPLIRPVESGFWAEYGDMPLDGFDYIYSELETRSVYSPPLLAPSALAIRYLGHARQLAALPVFYAARFLGLLGYASLAWLAVKLVPYGKWVVALLALAPTAVFQAATVTADSISNGLGILFIAGTIALSAKPKIGWQGWIGQLGLAALLFLAKPNLAFLALLPFLLITPAQFRARLGYLSLLAATAVLAVLEVGGWAWLAYPQAGPGVGQGEPLAQLSYMATHPFAAVQTLLGDMLEHGLLYLRQLVAGLGYDYWLVPAPVYLLYVGAVIAAVVASANESWPARETRIRLLLVFLAAFVGTQLIIYMVVNPVGRQSIFGVQGRYLAAIIALPLLVAIPRGSPSPTPVYARAAAGLSLGALATYGAGVFLVYHVQCGSAFFRPGLCYQPVYKNWAPDASYSEPVSSSGFLVQEFAPECDGLREVRVWVSGGAGERGGATEFELRDLLADRLLARQQVPNDKLPDTGWHPIQSEPQWDSAGERYRLSVSGTADSTVRVAYTLQPEYDRGRLFVGGHRAEVDLVFQYGCVAGLGRLIP